MSEKSAESEAQGLIELIDRLEVLLNDSELSEIEIEAGSTTLLLRKPGTLPQTAELPASGGAPADSMTASAGASEQAQQAVPAPLNAVLAPLTGLYYSSPSPGADAYVKPGAQVVVGQVIGLIEAMKLFNEIKSDRAGRVVRICAEDGALVKAKQPLVEVEA
jgi:acetyl-CoA carboxylase biotin carboxyl carrier protein